jgi:hypothetical protein
MTAGRKHVPPDDDRSVVRRDRKRRTQWAGAAAWVCFSFLCHLASTAFCGTDVLASEYARAYETELGAGTLGEAITLYRGILPGALQTNQALAGKILFRVGVCEREMGHIPECRQAWKQILELFPPEHSLVLRTRKELKDLERELDRVTVRGRILDDKGLPVSGACVMVGDWGNVPPTITATDGTFRVERQAAGRGPDGGRYCLVYAEHADLPLTVAGLWNESLQASGGRAAADPERGPSSRRGGSKAREARSSDFGLRPTLAVAGYVVDPNGRPVSGAAVRVTGFTDQAADLPMPMGNLLPPCESDSNGQYRIRGLAEGVVYTVTAEKEGYRAAKTVVGASSASGDAAKTSVSRIRVPGARVMHASEIILLPVGRVFVDETGVLRAEVNLNDPVERARLETAMAGYRPVRHDMGERMSWRDPVVARSPRFPFAEFPFALRWIQGDPITGSPLRVEDLKDHVVVYHFSSAYLDASLKNQYPAESGTLPQLAKLFGHRGVLCVWVLPAADDAEDAVQLALDTCKDLPIAVDRGGRMWQALGVTGYGGNVVVDRAGVMRTVCSDPQLFRVLKDVLLDDQGRRESDKATGESVTKNDRQP